MQIPICCSISNMGGGEHAPSEEEEGEGEGEEGEEDRNRGCRCGRKGGGVSAAWSRSSSNEVDDRSAPMMEKKGDLYLPPTLNLSPTLAPTRTLATSQTLTLIPFASLPLGRLQLDTNIGSPLSLGASGLTAGSHHGSYDHCSRKNYMFPSALASPPLSSTTVERRACCAFDLNQPAPACGTNELDEELDDDGDNIAMARPFFIFSELVALEGTLSPPQEIIDPQEEAEKEKLSQESRSFTWMFPLGKLSNNDDSSHKSQKLNKKSSSRHNSDLINFIDVKPRGYRERQEAQNGKGAFFLPLHNGDGSTYGFTNSFTKGNSNGDTKRGRVGKGRVRVRKTSVKKDEEIKAGGQQCNRKDGRGWQCSRVVKEGYTYCDHHLVKIKANHARSAMRKRNLKEGHITINSHSNRKGNSNGNSYSNYNGNTNNYSNGNTDSNSNGNRNSNSNGNSISNNNNNNNNSNSNGDSNGNNNSICNGNSNILCTGNGNSNIHRNSNSDDKLMAIVNLGGGITRKRKRCGLKSYMQDEDSCKQQHCFYSSTSVVSDALSQSCMGCTSSSSSCGGSYNTSCSFLHLLHDGQQKIIWRNEGFH